MHASASTSGSGPYRASPGSRPGPDMHLLARENPVYPRGSRGFVQGGAFQSVTPYRRRIAISRAYARTLMLGFLCLVHPYVGRSFIGAGCFPNPPHEGRSRIEQARGGLSFHEPCGAKRGERDRTPLTRLPISSLRTIRRLVRPHCSRDYRVPYTIECLDTSIA